MKPEPAPVETTTLINELFKPGSVVKHSLTTDSDEPTKEPTVKHSLTVQFGASEAIG